MCTGTPSRVNALRGSDPVSGGSVIVDCLGGLGALGGSIIFLGSLGVSAVQLLVFLFVSFVSFVSFVVQLLILSVCFRG